MRKTRLDELPQLINVLRGEMNIVGPRPERPSIVVRLREHVREYPLRHRVKPGITGWAQINHSYDASIEDVRTKVRYDLEYIRQQGVLFDLKIMALTLPVMMFKRGGPLTNRQDAAAPAIVDQPHPNAAPGGAPPAAGRAAGAPAAARRPTARLPGGRLRVLALIDTYEVSGPGRQLAGAARGLVDDGVDVVIAMLQRPGTPTPPYARSLAEAGSRTRCSRSRGRSTAASPTACAP
jgi:hypothetical protein